MHKKKKEREREKKRKKEKKEKKRCLKIQIETNFFIELYLFLLPSCERNIFLSGDSILLGYDALSLGN